MTFLRTALGASTAVAVVVAATSSMAMERTISTVTALQITNVIAQSYLQTFVAPLNKRGKGVLQLKYLGGQEIVPPRKAAAALKRGQFDFLSAPTAYYIGTVPEGYGLLAGNQGPGVLRTNGGFELLQKIYAEKAGSHLIAWGESMTSYHMYLAKKPKIGTDGIPDLNGYKMRATGTYRPLFRALGATTINIKSSEIITAVQRGTVDGFGFTDVSLPAIGLHTVTKFRVKPNFYQTNNVLTANLKTWASLTKAQKDLVNRTAIEYETTSIQFVEKTRLKEDKVSMAAGVQDVVLKGDAAAKYLAVAHGEIWKELKKRSKYHDQLKPLLYKEGQANRQIEIGQKLDEKR